jgi:Ran GTPase-activating protein (RanGAP) involved in mRNA processing and transport
MNADFNYVIVEFGEALGLNTKLEGLSIKDNKLKGHQYCNFWELMCENRSLRKINVSKTDVTDKVCARISHYLMGQDIHLMELNLSRNSISGEGLIALAEALKVNISLRTLNLAQNFIKESGMQEFVIALRVNNTLKELCLSFNKINNAGLSVLAGFLPENSSITVLDISRNTFTDGGFIDFAKGLAFNKGI